MLIVEHLRVETIAVSQTKLLHKIVVTYLLGVYSICHVINRTDEFVNIPSTGIPMVTVQLQSKLVHAINLGCSVFILDEKGAFWFLNEFISAHDEAEYRISTKHLIIILDFDNHDSSSVLETIQSHPAVEEIPNLLVIAPQKDNFLLLTPCCVGNVPNCLKYQLVDRYDIENDSFTYGNDLFPDKLHNQWGKVSKVASFHVVPWIIKRQVNHSVIRYNNQPYALDGLDGYLLTEFCIRYNCTWDLLMHEKDLYGKVFDNGTGNGMLGALLNRKVDFAIGAVGGYYSIFKFFSLSQPLQWVGVTCLVPKPKLKPYWLIIYTIFSRTVWCFIGVSFVAVTLCLYISIESTADMPKRDFSWIVFKVLRVFVLVSADFSRSKAAIASTVTSLLMFSIIVGNTYIGKIHSILAFPPYQTPISTVAELSQNPIRLNAEHVAWTYALDLSESLKDRNILAKFDVHPIEQLTEISNNGEEATMIAVLQNGHWMVGSWINRHNVELYRIMNEPLYYEYEAAYATKTWPLLDQFNYLASWIRDAGLFQYIELIEVYRYMDHWVQVSIEHSRDRPHSQLKNMKLEEISGALVLLGIGYAISLMAFLLEVGIYWLVYFLKHLNLRSIS